MNKRILIPGGGFAGAYTALHLERRLGGLPDVELPTLPSPTMSEAEKPPAGSTPKESEMLERSGKWQ